MIRKRDDYAFQPHHTAGSALSLLFVPAMYLSFAYYRFYIAQATQELMRVAVNNEEDEMVVSAR